jgi:hypothetical protein
VSSHVLGIVLGDPHPKEIHLGEAYDQLALQLAKIPALASQPDAAAYVAAIKPRLFRDDGVLRAEVLASDDRARAALSVFTHEPRSAWQPYRGRVLEAFAALIERDTRERHKKEPEKKDNQKKGAPEGAAHALQEVPAFPMGKLRPGDDLPVDLSTWTRIIANLPRTDGPALVTGIPIKAGGVVIKREAFFVWLSGGKMMGWMPIDEVPRGGSRSGEYWIWKDAGELQVGKRYAQDAAGVKKEAPNIDEGNDLKRRVDAGHELNGMVETFMARGHSLRESIHLVRQVQEGVLVQMIQASFVVFGIWAGMPAAEADLQALGEAVGRKLKGGKVTQHLGPHDGKKKNAQHEREHRGITDAKESDPYDGERESLAAEGHGLQEDKPHSPHDRIINAPHERQGGPHDTADDNEVPHEHASVDGEAAAHEGAGHEQTGAPDQVVAHDQIGRAGHERSAKPPEKDGRKGKQKRLREIADDPKVASADRGWIRQDLNEIKRGARGKVRVPPGKELAHERGREASKGYGYEHSNLQDEDLHSTQHKYDKFGRANKERPPTEKK